MSLIACLQASGVGVKDECLEAYEEIKMGHRWLYIIYRLTDDHRKVMVEEKAGLGKHREMDFAVHLNCY